MHTQRESMLYKIILNFVSNYIENIRININNLTFIYNIL